MEKRFFLFTEPFGPGNAARAVRDQCNFRRIKEEFQRVSIFFELLEI